jgi:hypothetical protein
MLNNFSCIICHLKCFWKVSSSIYWSDCLLWCCLIFESLYILDINPIGCISAVSCLFTLFFLLLRSFSICYNPICQFQFFFSFCQYWELNSAPYLAMQTLYQLIHAIGPSFEIGLFWDRVLLYTWASLNCNPPVCAPLPVIGLTGM